MRVFGSSFTLLQKKSILSKRILLAALNWGLGHATRCIPVIQKLRASGAEIWIASDGAALQLLRLEFPDLPFFKLPPYNIFYSRLGMIVDMAVQLPKIARAIRAEKLATGKFFQNYKFDIIISDNRYGCYNEECYNIFLTHQINIKFPLRAGESLIRHLNYRMIQNFNECWIPDMATCHFSLSGSLSHKHSLKTARYIGVLSRMKKEEIPKRYDIIAILSGPEPQRTYFEEKILSQTKSLPYHFLIVRGLPSNFEKYHFAKNVEVISFLNSKALNEAINASDLVIARSGYSTIMDLAQLSKPALLIPTPGQTEQLYLARRFEQQMVFGFQKQSEMNLADGIVKARSRKGLRLGDYENTLLEKAIQELLR